MTRPTIHLGETYTRYEGRIDADAAVAYALATNDPNDVHIRDDAVPPLFTVSLIQPAFLEASRRSADPGAIKGARGGVHAEHELRFWNPVRPGMAVQWQASTHSARQTPAGAIVTLRFLVSDLEGTPLVEHLWSSIHVGGVIEGDLGSPPADHTFPDAARQRLLGTHAVDVTRDQPFRYAGVSGDHVAHSMDDEAARREGYPRKILQGLCTLAMCSGAVVKVGMGGDPAPLRRLAARFSAPVFPGQQLAVSVYDAGRTDDGARALAFEAVSNGVTVVRHGRAELLES